MCKHSMLDGLAAAGTGYVGARDHPDRQCMMHTIWSHAYCQHQLAIRAQLGKP